ncbi:MAG: AurF N-oxygenase family protein [Candidatus Binatia bacterium]
MSRSASAILGDSYRIPDEERPAATRRESYPVLVERLSHQSVVKHFDAYADIDWNSPEFSIDPEDPRWELGDDDVLGATAWYRTQPQAVRARIGLHLVAHFMKIGVQFENILKRGLLEFASRLPNGSREFRYVYHEIIEEAQHSLMFQEFVNRTGFELPGLNAFYRFLARVQVIRLARTFPELFFLFVLGGEDPIDHVQRTALRSDRPIHPLLKRIMQIHVTEEARHLCFARSYLKQHTPELTRFRRRVLRLRAPFILAVMAQMMMRPSAEIIRHYGIPRAVVAEAYDHNPVHRRRTLEALEKVRRLCEEIRILTPRTVRLWKFLGIWQPATA